MSRVFGEPAHTAFVVTDIENTIERMLASGMGPAFMLRRLLSQGRYRGERHDIVTNVAFICSGSACYEFLQQEDNKPSAYREFLKRNPEGGLHHVAYYSTDFDDSIRRAREAGIELRTVQEFLTPDEIVFEIYTEPVNAADPLLVQLMYPGPTEKVFADMHRMAANWDGSDPVRNLFDLLPPEINLPVAPD